MQTQAQNGYGRVPSLHIPRPWVCAAMPPAKIPPDPWLGGECQQDSDCKDGFNGRCGVFGTSSVSSSGPSSCRYDVCRDAQDCATGEACICQVARFGGVPRNLCMTSNCRSDADCGPGGFCSPSYGSCGVPGGTIGYFCRTLRDTCVEHEDCSDGKGLCIYQGDRWGCSDRVCDEFSSTENSLQP